MNLSIPEAKMFGFAAYAPALIKPRVNNFRQAYEQNRKRIYSWAFWMTDNEMAAEQLMIETFTQAFASTERIATREIDRAFVSVMREYMPLGELTLNCAPCERVVSVRTNTRRVDLERAVVQLPNTEKMIFMMHDVDGYAYDRIARLLGISEHAARHGSHQARLRMRELLAA